MQRITYFKFFNQFANIANIYACQNSPHIFTKFPLKNKFKANILKRWFFKIIQTHQCFSDSLISTKISFTKISPGEIILKYHRHCFFVSDTVWTVCGEQAICRPSCCYRDRDCWCHGNGLSNIHNWSMFSLNISLLLIFLV